jgi:23S rRNA (uracil1939-C5)-methyltransferase
MNDFSASAAEVSCVHADTCAGCPLIHLSYADQLAYKKERLERALAPYPFVRPAIEDVAAAHPREAYRGRAKLMVSAARNDAGHLTPTIGLFARAQRDAKRSDEPTDHAVTDIPECRVLRPKLLLVTAGLRRLLARVPAGVGSCLVPEAMGGRLSAFDLREVQGPSSGVLVTLVVRSGEEPRPSELERAAAAIRAISADILGVAVNYRAAKSPQVLGRITRVLAGAEEVPDEAGAAYQLASYGSFVQAHRGQAERLRTLLTESLRELGLPRPLRLLDLYGGSGALSLALAKGGASVTLVESFRPAAASAARAAEAQGISSFAVHVGDVATTVGRFTQSATTFDAVLTNPPRRGMAPDVRKAIVALRPRAVAYVSCEPDSLARDLAHFARLGYAARRLHPLDMIPLTDQVEAVALLTPVAPPKAAVFYDDAEICVLEKLAYVVADPPKRTDFKLAWSASEDESGFAVACRNEALSRSSMRQVCLVLARGITAARGRIGKGATYDRIAKLNGHSLLRVTIERGNTGALRQSLARMSHPVVGDQKYGHDPTNRHFAERYLLDRPLLHCVELSFSHPNTRATIRVGSDLPGELGMVLKRLGHLPSMSPND